MLGREQAAEVGEPLGSVVEHVEDRQPVGDAQPDELVGPFQRIRETLGGLVVARPLEHLAGKTPNPRFVVDDQDSDAG